MSASIVNGTSNTHAARPTILIIGSGATGLALAQALTKSGIRCIVFERYPNLSTPARDWNMGLHWGFAALESMLPAAMLERLRSVHVDPSVPPSPDDKIIFLNGATGATLAEMRTPNFNRLRRGKLRALLAEGIDIRFDKALSALSYSADGASVTAHFADGSAHTGVLLVGADGARSTLRSLLLGPEAGRVCRLPYAATFVQSRFPAEQAQRLRKVHPLYVGAAHPGDMFAFLGMHDAAEATRPESWTFFYYISWNSSLEEQDATADWTPAQRLQQQKRFARGFADPWRTAFEATPDDAAAWYLGLTEWDPSADGHRWDTHSGRVTLAGDAAHTMTYQRGQGLNHSVSDAANLWKAIVEFVGEGARHVDIGKREAAIAAYEKEMVARSGEEVRLSSKNSNMLHHWDLVMKSPVFTTGMRQKEKQEEGKAA